MNKSLGATFNGKHTYKDYGLVIGNNNIVSMPKPKILIIEIPGSSTTLDLTESLTGKVEYEARTLTFKLGKNEMPYAWQVKLSEFMADVHGKKVKVILDIEPEFYYTGRCEVLNFSRSQMLGVIEVKVQCDPYKWNVNTSSEDWIWDIFNFENGIVREYKNLEVKDRLTLSVKGSDIPITPSFYVHTRRSGVVGSFYSNFHSKRYELTSGNNRFADLIVPEDGDIFYFQGNFRVSVDFRGGRL